MTVRGGDLAIVENTSEPVNITAGDDTIVSKGENVHVSLTPEKNTWLFPLKGKMTLEGYDEATRSGFGTTYANILSAVEDGRINFNNGNLKLGSAQVDVGKRSELMNFFDRGGKLQKVGYASSNDSLDVSGKTEDLILVAKENGSVTSGSGDDTILAGSGESSIWGGAGQDKMFGNTSANKNVATFYYTAGDGRDSISNFDFITDAQDATADKVQLVDEANLAANSFQVSAFSFQEKILTANLRGSDVMIKVDDADGFLMLENAQGKSFRLNDDLIAKVDTNVEFDGFTNSYVGIGERATLTVGKGAGDVEVWLSDDSLEYHGKMYDGNFKVLDASQSDGSNILAGNELRNVITGGSGENSLWGGIAPAAAVSSQLLAVSDTSANLTANSQQLTASRKATNVRRGQRARYNSERARRRRYQLGRHHA